MTTTGAGPYEAEIRWTTHGVAHVRAADWAGLGFGQGFACARDNLPTIADQIVKVRSERARFFGPGPLDAHISSDFGYRAIGIAERAGALRAAQPAWIREMVAGYVAGYNAALVEATTTGSLPEWCADASWIRPIDETDLYTYLGDVALMASGRNLAQIVGSAEPPDANGPRDPAPMEALGGPTLASNGWAVGGDATASGHGMVLANPHFPWYGEARFWECHLTIPGTLDVYGVSLLGTPGVQMGFTDGVAWAHTFSAGYRFTMYRLALDPSDPTRYRYGDEVRAMTPSTHTIDVLGDDGTTTTLDRTLWTTHYGPMLNLPLMGWGTDTAFTYRDANIDNDAVLEQFLGMDRSHDLDQFRAVYDDVDGLPWVNTLAADRTGRIWYTDASATPRLTDGARERFRDRLGTDLVATLLAENRVALLEGSDPDDEWVEVPGARVPGLEPPSSLPRVERRDFVVNANDSHWMPNPAARLEGFSPLGGPERQPLSLRTRQNLLSVGALAERGGVTVDDLVATVLDNRSLSADLLLDAVVERCRAAGDHHGDLSAAADVLAAWDRRTELDSVGAVLWRETMRHFTPADRAGAGPLFAVPFDPTDPVNTPRDLTPAPPDGPDPVIEAVTAALAHLHTAGVAIDAPLGDAQWAARGDERVPVHGGTEVDGVMNILAPATVSSGLPVNSLESRAPTPPAAGARPGLSRGGYQVDYGTSFVMAVELTNDGPRGVGLLSYGQSGDARSPHHRDGTEAYAAKAVRPLLFCEDEIAADPHLVVRRVTG